MLVAGCLLWGQRITPKRMWHDAGWSQGFSASPSLASLLACVFANRLILLIVADRYSRVLYEPLQISCCSFCESLWILADRSGSFSICFRESLRIHADPRTSTCRGAPISVPTFPSLSDVSKPSWWVWGGQVSIFPLIWFSVTVPDSSCLQGWFSLTGLPWIPPCLGLKCSGPLPTFKAPVPKLIYWRWV